MVIVQKSSMHVQKSSLKFFDYISVIPNFALCFNRSKRMIEIPEINPIQLMPSAIADSVLRDFDMLDCSARYYQKYQRGDITRIQVLIPNDDDVLNWNIRIYDSNDIIQSYMPSLKMFAGLIDESLVMEYTIHFASLNEGLYYFVLSSPDSEAQYRSDFICVKDEHEDTKLLRYYNSVNTQDTAFSSGVIFALRVEIQGRETQKSVVPKATESYYNNDMGGYVTLYSDPFFVYRVNFGGIRGIPNHMIEIIHKALSCDTVLIDNERVNKTSETPPEAVGADIYPYQSWIFELSYGERLTIDETVTYPSAVYASSVCQKKVQVIIYLSAVYASSVCQLFETTTTYLSAEYASPVCQQLDDSISYPSAEFTNPVCQQTEEFLPVGIKLDINLKKSILRNSIEISWGFNNPVGFFSTTARLKSVITDGRLDTPIDIKFDTSGQSGTEIQNTGINITSFVPGGTELISLDPDTFNGEPIIVRITLN